MAGITAKVFHEEIVRLLRIYFNQSTSPNDKEIILKSVKNNLDGLGKFEHEQLLLKEQRKALKERRKYGVR